MLDSRLNFANSFFGPFAVLFPRGTYAYRRCLRRASWRDCTTPGLVRGAIQVRYSSEATVKCLGRSKCNSIPSLAEPLKYGPGTCTPSLVPVLCGCRITIITAIITIILGGLRSLSTARGGERGRRSVEDWGLVVTVLVQLAMVIIIIIL